MREAINVHIIRTKKGETATQTKDLEERHTKTSEKGI